MAAAARLSPREFGGQVQAAVRQAWPHLPQDAQLVLARRLTQEAGEHLRDRAAFKLQDTAVKMMRDTAKDFRAVAGGPARLQGLAARLSRRGETPEEAAKTKSLREVFGIEADQRTVAPGALAAALEARAKLLDAGAANMRGHGVPTRFRALAEQDLGDTFMKQAGMAPGSFLAAQVDAVKTRGVDERETLGRLKLATGVLASVLSGGLGGAAMGIGASVVMSAPSAAQAWSAVDTAKAGEAAGTMKAGAGREATLHATLATAEVPVSIALGTAMNAAAHGVTEGLAHGSAKVLDNQVAHAAAHGVVHGAAHLTAEVAVSQAAHGVEHHARQEGEAGRNALGRAGE